MHNQALRILTISSWAILLEFFVTTPSSAGLVKLAESGDREPNGTNEFFQIDSSPSLTENGQVVFYTDLRNNGFLQGWGIFRADPNGVTTVAKSGQASPDLNGNLYTFNSSVAVNSTGQVFAVGLKSTLGGAADASGVYEWTAAGGLAVVARAGQAVPTGPGTLRPFENVVPRFNRLGQSAFRCNAANPTTTLLCRGFGGAITRLAYVRQPSPDGNGSLLGFGDPSLNNRGTIAFSASIFATNSSSAGLYLADENGLTVLLRTGQSVPNGDGQFFVFPTPDLALNDSNQVAFVANLTGTTAGAVDALGVYRADAGGVVELVRKSQIVPGGNGRFLAFGVQNPVSINDAGVVEFRADLTGTSGGAADSQAIYLATGISLTQVVRTGQPAPDGNGVFSVLHDSAFNNRGEVAFVATLVGTAGGSVDNQGVFFVDSSLVVHQVLRAGQVIGGETVGVPTFFAGPNYGGLSGFNDAGQLALSCALNGNAGIFLWDNATVPNDLRILGAAPVLADIIISFEAQAGTTNFVQAAPSVTGPFADVGDVVVSGTGVVVNHFTDVGGATNPVRFYRIRQVR